MSGMKSTITRDDTGIILFSSQYRSPSQRREYGKMMRMETPREAHAFWSPSQDRPHPAEIIQSSNEKTDGIILEPSSQTVLSDPLSFFCGSLHIMAYDLSGTPRTNINVQVCGDCHLFNFGVYATGESKVLTELIHFDETTRAPFEWDLKRLVTSFQIATLMNRLSEKGCKQVVHSCLASYREAILSFCSMKMSDIRTKRYRSETISELAKSKVYRQGKDNVAGKRTPTNWDGITPIITSKREGRIKIVDQNPHMVHTPPEKGIDEIITTGFDTYYSLLNRDTKILLDRYQIMDYVAISTRTGWINSESLILLLNGEKEGTLFLQLKQACLSILEPYVRMGSNFKQSERIIQGKRILQSEPDLFLGYAGEIEGRQYYIQQFREIHHIIDIMHLNQPGLESYARICGYTLALAHSRSGDASEIAGYIGKSDRFDKALATFARCYARQNELDYRTMVTWEKSRRLEARKKSRKDL